MESLVNKTILFEIRYYNKDKILVATKIGYGTVERNDSSAIFVKEDDGNLFSLPPYISDLEKQICGKVHKLQNGRHVYSPDYLGNFDVFPLPEVMPYDVDDYS